MEKSGSSTVLEEAIHKILYMDWKGEIWDDPV